MKKYLSIALMALAGLFTWSCQDDNIVSVYDPANVQVQGLGDIAGCELAEDGADITTTYSAADFNLNVPVSYSLYADVAGGDFSTAKKVEATIADGNITIAQPKLNKLLGNLGAVAGEQFMVDFRLDAALLNNKGAAVDQTIQHSNVVTATFTTYEAEKVLEVVDVPGDYQGWAPDKYPKLFCYAYDGVNFRGVVDFGAEKKGGNGFKITYGGNWDSASGNWGSEVQAEEPEAASMKLINGDASQNIVCYSANRYYLFAFDKDQLTLTKVMAFDQVGVIGLNGDWDNDIVMEYNMYKGRFYADVDAAAATEFKFRLDGAWDVNWGGSYDALSGGGANLPLDAGQYRIYFYMNDVTVYAEADASMYGQDEPTVDPEPDPEPTYQGWGIIGDFNGWSEDVDMTEVMPGIWVSPVMELTGGWKVRYADAWDADRGGDTPSEVGVAVKAVPGGANINLNGTFAVVYNANAEVIYALRWGIVGSIASIDGFSWNADVPMNLGADGKWYSSPVALTTADEFKLRENAGWDVNRGGTCAAVEEAFGVENNGANIQAPADGTYIVIYDPATETITLSKNFWGAIGDFNEWSGDVFLVCQGNDQWAAYNQTYVGGWKLRQGADWAVNCGGTFTESGVPFEGLQDGPNIDTGGDTIDIFYSVSAGRITVTK